MLEQCECASCVGVVVATFDWGSRQVGVILGGTTLLGALSFLSFLVEKVRQVDEVLPFVCLQCLRMGRQGKVF